MQFFQLEKKLNMKGKNMQIRNSTVDFMVFTKNAGSDSIEVRVLQRKSVTYIRRGDRFTVSFVK